MCLYYQPRLATHRARHMNSKSIVRLIVCMLILFGCHTILILPAMAQGEPTDPVINLVVKDEPLSDVLDSIARETGYHFNLTPQWEDYPVSATINNLPLQQGLKRLLRSLNHTILWEADQTVTIKVYGKVVPGNSGGVSFAAPPQSYEEQEEPSVEVDNEPPDENEETIDRENDTQQESLNAPNDETDTPPDDRPTHTEQRPEGQTAKE